VYFGQLLLARVYLLVVLLHVAQQVLALFA
jgi:hypothetical protein